MKRQGAGIYGSSDPRELPAYALVDASHYLLIPRATVRSWIAGRRYPTISGPKFFRPVIAVPKSQPRMLSFLNLIEAHVLDAIRREHQIPLDKVRIAIDYLRKEFGSDHPLADHRLETDGLDLFVHKYGQLINITRSGQTAMKEVLHAYLRRIERDPSGVAVRLYPFTRKREHNEPRVILIDPQVSFGRPVLAGTGVPTSVIAERYKAGDSVEALAQDYGRERLDIEEAIRCELQLEAA